MLVGDVVIFGRSIFRVTGIYLGAVGVQNLVGLKSVSLKSGGAHGHRVKEMLVPEELVKYLPLYRRLEPARPRPTVDELEKLLNSDEDCEVFVLPDGSISAE